MANETKLTAAPKFEVGQWVQFSDQDGEPFVSQIDAITDEGIFFNEGMGYWIVFDDSILVDASLIYEQPQPAPVAVESLETRPASKSKAGESGQGFGESEAGKHPHRRAIQY